MGSGKCLDSNSHGTTLKDKAEEKLTIKIKC
jgi:hypothetical protein